MDRPDLRTRPAAAPQAFAIQRDQVGGTGPQAPRPSHETGLEQRRIDPVQHHPKPVLLRRSKAELCVFLGEIPVDNTPVRNLVTVVAARDRGAGDQKQHLPQRIPDLAALVRVPNRPEMLRQQRKTIPDKNLFHDGSPPATTRLRSSHDPPPQTEIR